MTTDLDLLTVNLWGLPWPAARHRSVRKRRFVDYLRGSAYDLIAIQELWWPWRRTLARAPVVVPRSRRDSGLALAGRLTLDGARVEHFRSHRGLDRLKRKGVLHASARTTSGASLAVATVHLQAGRRHGLLRAGQLDEVLRGLALERRPVVLLGDFNLHGDVDEDHRSAERLRSAGFCDAAETLERCEPTYVATNPYVRGRREAERLDRVYLRGSRGMKLRPLEAEIVHTGALFSDHHPLRVRARLSA